MGVFALSLTTFAGDEERRLRLFSSTTGPERSILLPLPLRSLFEDRRD